MLTAGLITAVFFVFCLCLVVLFISRMIRSRIRAERKGLSVFNMSYSYSIVSYLESLRLDVLDVLGLGDSSTLRPAVFRGLDLDPATLSRVGA